MATPALATASAASAAPASLEPLVQSLKDQTAKFRDTFDQWCTQQQQGTEQEQVVHRDVMKQAEGTRANVSSSFPSATFSENISAKISERTRVLVRIKCALVSALFSFFASVSLIACHRGVPTV